MLKENRLNTRNQANVMRARARRFAMQAVYQHLITNDAFTDIAEQVKQREHHHAFDCFFFDEIIVGMVEFGDKLEQQIIPFLERSISQLDTVEHAILLVGVYELSHRATPPKVAINEAIILAKKFGGENSHKLVNSVLDKLYKSIIEK